LRVVKVNRVLGGRGGQFWKLGNRNRFCGKAQHSKHRNVVIVPELFCGSGNRSCGLACDCCCALEAEEFPFFGACLDHSICDERKPFAGGELEACLCIAGRRTESQRKSAGNGHLASIEVGGKVTGIGRSACAVRVDADNEASCKPPWLRPSMRMFIAERISAGLVVKRARVRTVPTSSETVMAAGIPLPLTSPMMARKSPASRGRIWKKSPPTCCAGRYSDSISNPVI
jgi:hypothetical protein